MMTMISPWADPPTGCRKCPRLVAYRKQNKAQFPDFHNGPVPTWGARDAPLFIVGLAPGLRGANRTGQPFTGDASGALLFECLIRAGFASEQDGRMILHQCAITNAVACVPPENKPIAAEITACRPYLAQNLRHPKVVLALGKLAHDATLKALGLRLAAHPFTHGAVARLDRLTLVSSYHPSRYNVATKRINAAMLDEAIMTCAEHLNTPQKKRP